MLAQYESAVGEIGMSHDRYELFAVSAQGYQACHLSPTQGSITQ
jgi:hypothetical protein